MNQSEALELVKKHGSKLAAARAAGVPRSTFNDYCAGKYKSRGGGGAPAAPAALGPEFVSQSDVVAAHDVVGKTLQAVRDIPAGAFLPDDALRRGLGVGYDRWRQVRGSLRLAGHFIETPDKKVLWGRKDTVAATAAKLKELL